MIATEVKVVGLSFNHVREQLKQGDRVRLVAEPDNKYDPNALEVQTLDGVHLGYVGKKDPLRMKMLAKARQEEVTLPVLIANYHEEGDDILWDDVEEGDLVQLWLRAYSRTPIEDSSFEEIESFTGEQVMWSEYQHICTDMQGNELLGGSTYAAQFEKEFDKENIAEAYAKKNSFLKQQVIEYWNSLGVVSQDYGTSIHTALEHYSRFYRMVGHEKALPRQTHLREAVKAFLEVSDFENCIPEPLITDVEKGMSGWVDNLRLVGKNEVIVEDYKTNTFNKPSDYDTKWGAKLKNYHHQLNFYGTILENQGYTVKGLVVWHWHEGQWNKHELEFNKVKEYER